MATVAATEAAVIPRGMRIASPKLATGQLIKFSPGRLGTFYIREKTFDAPFETVYSKEFFFFKQSYVSN